MNMLGLSRESTQSARSVSAGLPPYASVLGLVSNPFPVTPDEMHYFFTPKIEVIYQELIHFIEMRKGFLLLTGDVGLGKTTLLRRLLASFDKARYNTALILTGFLDQSELVETIALDFGLTLPFGARRIDCLAALNEFFLKESAKGKINVVFIDDAQALSVDALDVVRQLSNLETAQSKLIQVVLCGQPELLDTLNQYGLRQVKSRIALHHQLQPLDLEQTQAYIHHCLDHAGRSEHINITADGLQQVQQLTEGFPRRIHQLMDRCLYALVACDSRMIDRALVRRVWKDVGWQEPTVVKMPFIPRRQLAFFWAGLVVFSMVVFGIFFVNENPSLAGMTGSSSGAATKSALIAAPKNWTVVRAGFTGLAELDWPIASNVPALTQQFKKTLQPYPWQIVVAVGEWVAPCNERPLLTLHDAEGSTWHLSFVELNWPIAPVVLGHSSAILRQLQQYLTSQGWLRLADVDGVMGPRTAVALARFQLAQGLEGTGQFNPATVYRLSCRLASGNPSPVRS